LLAPLSGSIDDSRQPVFNWTPARRARVDVCADRACGRVLASFAGSAGHAQPEAPLPAGTLFWRTVAGKDQSATWQITIAHRDAGLDTAFATVPDYDGDGIADVAFGTPAAGAGSVAVFFGSPEFPFGHTTTLNGGPDFGRAVACVGDTNGDGFVELAVTSGAGNGTVTIYYGSASGPVPGPTLRAGPVTAGFGTTMAGAGDVDGDGYGDVIVGGLEAAQVFKGGARGLSTDPSFSLTPPLGDATSVQGPGDVNADGLPDVMVGNVVFLGAGGKFVLGTGVILGSISGFAGDENADGFVDFDSFGVAAGTPDGIDVGTFLLQQGGQTIYATAGDVDADGYFDQISEVIEFLGVPERNRVYFGAAGTCQRADCRRFTPLLIPGHDNQGGHLIAIIAAVGDVNGDGVDDLIATTPETGNAYLYLGRDNLSAPVDVGTALNGPVGFGSSVPTLFGTALRSP
jgi:hypothetical protein